MQAQKLTLFNFLILEKDFLQKSFITSTTDLLLTNNIVCVPKGSFRWTAFDACGCDRQLRFRRDRKFSIFLHRTLLPQPHSSNEWALSLPIQGLETLWQINVPPSTKLSLFPIRKIRKIDLRDGIWIWELFLRSLFCSTKILIWGYCMVQIGTI